MYCTEEQPALVEAPKTRPRARQQPGASVGVPLRQVYLLRLLQASLNCDVSQCTNTQLGLELPENWHHIYRISADGSSRRYSYCVRVCRKCSRVHHGHDLGSFEDLESALLVNDVFQLLVGKVCRLYVLQPEDRDWLHMLFVKQCIAASIYVVRPLLDLLRPLTDAFKSESDHTTSEEMRTPVREKRKHQSESDVRGRGRDRSGSSSSSSSCSSSSSGATTGYELVSTPTTGNMTDTAQSYSFQLVALEYDFIKVIFAGYGEAQHLSLVSMMQKLASTLRSGDVDAAPFAKRPALESDQFMSLYLRSVTAVIARQVFGLLADLTVEDTLKISSELENKLPVNRLCNLLDYDISEVREALQRHPDTGLSLFQLLQVAVWTDLWDGEYKSRINCAPSGDHLITAFEFDPVKMEQYQRRCAHRVHLLEWGLRELVRDNSVEEKSKFWAVYNITLMVFSDSVASSLIAELPCGLKHYREALEAHRKFQAWSSSVDRDASYLRVVCAENRARLIVMLPRGFIDDDVVHDEIYTLVQLRYEVFGTLVRLDRDIMNGQRLREMELYSVIAMLHYMVHYDSVEGEARPRIFNDFPEFNKPFLMKRTREVLCINEHYSVTHRAGFFTNNIIFMVYALLKLLDHPMCYTDMDPKLIATMRSSALVILDVNNRRDARAGILGSMYLNRPSPLLPEPGPSATSSTRSSDFRTAITSLFRSDSLSSSALMDEALNDRFFEQSFDLLDT